MAQVVVLAQLPGGSSRDGLHPPGLLVHLQIHFRHLRTPLPPPSQPDPTSEAEAAPAMAKAADAKTGKAGVPGRKEPEEEVGVLGGWKRAVEWIKSTRALPPAYWQAVLAVRGTRPLCTGQLPPRRRGPGLHRPNRDSWQFSAQYLAHFEPFWVNALAVFRALPRPL